MASMKGRHNKIKYFFMETTKALFDVGYGKSKFEAFQQSYEKDRTRRSDAIHSFSTYVSYEKTMAKFGDFLSEEMGIKYERDFKKLSTDEIYVCIDKYFEKQHEEGLAKKTLERHISALNKVLGAINPEIKEYFTPDNRARWRDGVEPGDNDRYNNPEKIVESLEKISETSHAIAQLQRLTGARVGDVKKIEIDEENKKVIIENSKGGRDRAVYFDYFPEQFEKVKEYKEILDRALEEKSFSEIRKEEYYKDLRKACREAGEPYRGSHSFRFEWAQERYEVISQLPKEEQIEYFIRILEERGKSEKEIGEAMEKVGGKDAWGEAIISEELGHSRLDISRHYLRIKAK